MSLARIAGMAQGPMPGARMSYRPSGGFFRLYDGDPPICIDLAAQNDPAISGPVAARRGSSSASIVQGAMRGAKFAGAGAGPMGFRFRDKFCNHNLQFPGDTSGNGKGFTVWAFVRPDVDNIANISSYIACKAASASTESWSLYTLPNSGTLGSFVRYTSGSTAQGNVGSRRGWMFVAFVFINRQNITYLNCEQIGSGFRVGGISGDNGDLYIGSYVDGTGSFAGRIDHVGIDAKPYSIAMLRGLMQNPWMFFGAPPLHHALNTSAASSSITVTPANGAITFTGYAPAVSGDVQSAPQPGALDFTGYNAAVSADSNMVPSAGLLSVVGYSPSLALDQQLTVGASAIVIAGHQPAVATSDDMLAFPAAGALAFTGHAPAVLIFSHAALFRVEVRPDAPVRFSTRPPSRTVSA